MWFFKPNWSLSNQVIGIPGVNYSHLHLCMFSDVYWGSLCWGSLGAPANDAFKEKGAQLELWESVQRDLCDT